MQLGGRALAQPVPGPGLQPQHSKNQNNKQKRHLILVPHTQKLVRLLCPSRPSVPPHAFQGGHQTDHRQLPQLRGREVYGPTLQTGGERLQPPRRAPRDSWDYPLTGEEPGAQRGPLASPREQQGREPWSQGQPGSDPRLLSRGSSSHPGQGAARQGQPRAKCPYQPAPGPNPAHGHLPAAPP